MIHITSQNGDQQTVFETTDKHTMIVTREFLSAKTIIQDYRGREYSLPNDIFDELMLYAKADTLEQFEKNSGCNKCVYKEFFNRMASDIEKMKEEDDGEQCD